MNEVLSAAPQPAYRMIPSQYPPIGLFDTVATAADLPVILELVGWTNDRLVVERLARLPEGEWVYGIPNASIVMAAFLHVPPEGMRFNGAELGAWYAADDIRTAAAEVGHHLRRETVARRIPTMTRTYRTYSAILTGEYLDIRGEQATRADVYASAHYGASQAMGESVRASDGAGILYDSLRRPAGNNVVVFRPRKITSIVQTDHFEITVSVASPVIDVWKLTA